MDAKTLISDAKARFSHNAAKAYLKEKFEARLIVADQGGLWRATPELIGYLASNTNEQVILVDNFENPVLVNRILLHDILNKTYNSVLTMWLDEWKELERQR